jgi:Protein of unknown function (DUF2786)
MIINEKDAILNKIKKLLALSHSPNENEAVVAAQKANELLTKYNLSLGDVYSGENVFTKEIICTYKKAISWKGQLLAGVAFLNFCIAYEVRFDGISASVLYGRQANAITGKVQWEYLVDVVEKLNAQSNFVGLAARNAFKIGCAVRIANRMRSIVEDQERTGIYSEGNSVSALVVQSLHQKMEAEKKQMMVELGDAPSKKPGTYSDRDAYSEGLRAGDSVGLSKQLMGVV